MILAYPVISFDPAIKHAGSERNLLGEHPDPKLVAELSNELRVTAQTPPTFLFHTTNDPGVPVENSVRFYLALVKANVPAEMHLFENGPHGVGLALGDPALSAWNAAAACERRSTTSSARAEPRLSRAAVPTLAPAATSSRDTRSRRPRYRPARRHRRA